jgi:hypothetical protein
MLVYLELLTVTLLTITNANPPAFRKFVQLGALRHSIIFMRCMLSKISMVFGAHLVRKTCGGVPWSIQI